MAKDVLSYLRSIDAKLDRLNERLDKFLSAPKGKRAARFSDAGKALVAHTPEHAAELAKKHPDADIIIITGVPRAKRKSRH